MAASPPRVTVSSRSGRVRVVAEPRADVSVRGGTHTVDGDGNVTVDGGASSRVEITCPEGTHVVVATASGRVTLDGVFGDVRITTSSGHVEVGEAASVDVRSASGAIVIGDCTGECRCVAKSGRIEVGRAGTLVADSASGRVVAGRVGSAAVHTATGRVRIGADGSAPVVVRSVSGAVEITLPSGCAPRARLATTSGRIVSECPTGDDLEIDVETVSGRIELSGR